MRSSRCIDVPQATLDAIAGDDFVPISGAAVKSEDFEQVFMVAARFQVDGDETEAVWAVTDLQSPGPIMSVDAVAAVVTTWPQGTASNPMSIVDDGAREAIDCLG